MLQCAYPEIVFPLGAGIVDLLFPWNTLPEFGESRDIHPLFLELGMAAGVTISLPTISHYLKLALQRYSSDPSLLRVCRKLGLSNVVLSHVDSDLIVAALKLDFVEFIKSVLSTSTDINSIVHFTMSAVRVGAERCTKYMLHIIQQNNINVHFPHDNCMDTFKKILQPGNSSCVFNAIAHGFIPLGDFYLQALRLACLCHSPPLREHMTSLSSCT